MDHRNPDSAFHMQSTVRGDSTVLVEIARAPVPEPGEEDVVVRMEAAPINPSDLGVMFAGADYGTVVGARTELGPAILATLPRGAVESARARVDRGVRLGGEGAGVVVGAGEGARALLGRTVALRWETYSQYRTLGADQCLVLPEGTAPERAASCFINPLTVLGMVETMRSEGHSALVHTAASSNLGRMLQRVCTADGIGLVNVVRSPQNAAVLREIGATHVVDSSEPDFEPALTEAIAETGATVGFEATGGGELASAVLAAMERAQSQPDPGARYGSTVHKQVYVYGALDPGPTILRRRYGMAWGVGGWLLTNFLYRIGSERVRALRRRVAAEIETTFRSEYSDTVSLAGALEPGAVARYTRKATGTKYLIAPQAPWSGP